MLIFLFDLLEKSNMLEYRKVLAKHAVKYVNVKTDNTFHNSNNYEQNYLFFRPFTVYHRPAAFSWP